MDDDDRPFYTVAHTPMVLRPVEPMDVRVCELPLEDEAFSDVVLAFTLADDTGAYDVHIALRPQTAATISIALRDMAWRITHPEDDL